MNDMRKLINLTENVYADEASKHIEGLAEVMANYLTSVSDDLYLYSDISEFSGRALEIRVTELIQAKKKGLGEDKDEFVSKLDNSFDDKIKEAYLAGHLEGTSVGMDRGTSRMFGRKEETPEEAYEHWKKHGF